MDFVKNALILVNLRDMFIIRFVYLLSIGQEKI